MPPTTALAPRALTVALHLRRLCTLMLVLALPACSSTSRAPDLSAYDVVWTTPSEDASGSMPIGNGTLGANVWVEPGGDLVMYLSRTDAWSENERLLKLCQARVRLTPNPCADGAAFSQRLSLRDGRIEFTWSPADGLGATRMSLWVDAHDPVLHISIESPRDVTAQAFLETWRTERRRITDPDEQRSTWAMRDAPADVEITESQDERVGSDAAPSAVAIYHRNEHSIVPFTIARQGLGDYAASFPDPLLHRTFGAWLTGPGFERRGEDQIVGSGRRLSLAFATDSRQTSTAEEWVQGIASLAASTAGADASRARTQRWWREFWDRSWIFVKGDPGRHAVSEPQHPLRMGVDSNGNNRFKGLMAAAQMAEYAASAQEIRSLASARGARLDEQKGRVWRAVDNLKAASLGLDEHIASSEEPSIRFEGNDIIVPANGAPRIGNGFTIAAWIKPDAGLGPARIFDRLSAGRNDGFLFDTHPGRDLRLIVGEDILSIGGVIEPGTWQHVAATYDAATGGMAIYHNGELVGDSPGSMDDGPAPPSLITRGYILQRWMIACASRGTIYPPKFNGSIFTVEPRHVNGKPWNPDWRAWGGSYWWQNTRLPYYAMPAAGDYDLMAPLFDFYTRALEPSRVRARAYYNAQGVYFPETMTMFATYANGDYGWNREGLDRGDISPCPWWQWAWNQSLELTQLMLDYYEHTGDEQFLREKALPMADASLEYFESRFVTTDAATGARAMRITPTQAVETYWHGVVDDAPTVAGIRCVTQQLLALPPGRLSESRRQRCLELLAICPPLPVKVIDGIRVAAPAGEYKDQRSNCETAELYPVFPFRLWGIGRPDLDAAIEAYQRRHDKSTVGWTQDGMFAAMLGLTDEAQRILTARARNSHSSFRFPAMWGPNFDWVPDQCHGSNLMTMLQQMILQTDGDRIYILPAWPSDWSARFKLHAGRGTVVEGVVQDGVLVDLDVTPRARAKDVIVQQPRNE